MAKRKTKVASTRMKQTVKATMALVNKAIRDGDAAINANRRAIARTSTTTAEKKRLRAANRKNANTQRKAKKMMASLRDSERLANSMCPQQILFSEFNYT